MKKYIIMLLLAGGLLAACVNDGTLVSEPTAVMQYQRNPTQARLLALAHAYAEAVNLNLDEGVAHPGLYADYGVALAQLGCPEQANIMFNNEKLFFPHSAPYVDMLKQTLTPAYAADTRTDTSHIDLATLDTIRVTLTADAYIHGVYLPTDARMSDNYFDLLPGQVKAVAIEGDVSGLRWKTVR